MDDAAMMAWYVLTVVFETVPGSRENVDQGMKGERPRVGAAAVG